MPACNCGFVGDAESVASLTGIEQNLLPYWLTRFPDHRLADGRSRDGGEARCAASARQVDAMALAHLRAAGHGARPAVHHRGQLHRPARLLRRRRRGRGGAALPRLVPGRCREHTLLREEQTRRDASPSCPTSTWLAPAAPRSQPSPWHGRSCRRSQGDRPRQKVMSGLMIPSSLLAIIVEGALDLVEPNRCVVIGVGSTRPDCMRRNSRPCARSRPGTARCGSPCRSCPARTASSGSRSGFGFSPW